MIIIFVFLFTAINTITKGISAEGAGEMEYVKISIKSGDTLWRLAKKFTPESKDVRKTIHEIAVINDLHTLDIYPGQVITIPLN